MEQATHCSCIYTRLSRCIHTNIPTLVNIFENVSAVRLVSLRKYVTVRTQPMTGGAAPIDWWINCMELIPVGPGVS
jgi:hypothetical protein